MQFDFHPPSGNNRPGKKKRSPQALVYLVILAVVFLAPFYLNNAAPDTQAHTSTPAAPPAPEIRRDVIEGAINTGDTISGLLDNYLTQQEIHKLGKLSKSVFPLTRICTGQPYRICLVDGELERFEYEISKEDQLVISFGDEQFDIRRQPIEYQVTTELVRGEISTSLFDAVTESGETAELAMNLADIFAWDVDFILDIRSGDSFQALVEKRSREGEPAGYGRILAAEFTNQGESYDAFLFKDGNRPASYYDAKGDSVRKLFLKAPLSFSRISSGFTMRRFHPITKTWKAHPAIDYVAPRGTPIKSVGDGTIVRFAKDRNNGRHIKVRHNGTYETLYLHMNSFARGMKKGKKVAQGQVIGYVGSTGLATGPHLCFRMYRHGKPVNPARIKAKSAKPVSAENLAMFRNTIQPLQARLETGGPLIARRDTNETLNQKTR